MYIWEEGLGIGIGIGRGRGRGGGIFVNSYYYLSAVKRETKKKGKNK
jgi:hypothetical protein